MDVAATENAGLHQGSSSQQLTQDAKDAIDRANGAIAEHEEENKFQKAIAAWRSTSALEDQSLCS